MVSDSTSRQLVRRRHLIKSHSFFPEIDLAVTVHSGNSKNSAGFYVEGEKILLPYIALNDDPVPFLSVTDVVERRIELCRPEERPRIKRCRSSRHIVRRNAALLKSCTPVLDTRVFTGPSIGEMGNVACRVQGITDRQILGGDHTAILVQRDTVKKVRCRLSPDTHNDEISSQSLAILEDHLLNPAAARKALNLGA